jgi:hypothetical protein
MRNKANSPRKTRAGRPRHETPCGVTTNGVRSAKQSQFGLTGTRCARHTLPRCRVEQSQSGGFRRVKQSQSRQGDIDTKPFIRMDLRPCWLAVQNKANCVWGLGDRVKGSLAMAFLGTRGNHRRGLRPSCCHSSAEQSQLPRRDAGRAGGIVLHRGRGPIYLSAGREVAPPGRNLPRTVCMIPRVSERTRQCLTKTPMCRRSRN